MRITHLPQIARNMNRFREIVGILGKYGLAGWLRPLDPTFMGVLLRTAEGRRISEYTPDERVRLALTDLGPTFIKLGQMLSTRGDLVGPSLAAELTKLQSSTPPDAPEAVRATVEAELGRPVSEVYREFDEIAAASASIGQVHRARLRDGTSVVVKVQHEGIERVIERNLDILGALAELAEKYSPELRLYQPKQTTAEFRRTLTRELDFRQERRNLQRFIRSFEHDDTVRLPHPYEELSTHRVLTMEAFKGYSIADTERLAKDDIDTCELAKRGARIYLDMIFRDGVYHADPHPGNIWVLEDGVIGLLDCGMVGRIDQHLQDEFAMIVMAAIDNDPDGLTASVIRLGTTPPELDRDALRSEIGDYIGDYIGDSLEDLDLSGGLTGMTDIIRRHRVVLPSAASLLIKVLVMLEGTSRSLDRNFNLVELLKPYQRQMVRRRLSKRQLVRRLRRSYRDWQYLLDVLPQDVASVLERVRKGQLDVNLNHRHLDTTVNRLVYGIILAALFVGSSMILSREVPPRLFGVSIVGFIGCVVALSLGTLLLVIIHRSGGLRSDD